MQNSDSSSEEILDLIVEKIFEKDIEFNLFRSYDPLLHALSSQ